MPTVAPVPPVQAQRPLTSADVPPPARTLVRPIEEVPPVKQLDTLVEISSSLEDQKRAVEAAAELAQNYKRVPEGISAYEIIQKIQVADASLQANTLMRLRIPLEEAA